MAVATRTGRALPSSYATISKPAGLPTQYKGKELDTRVFRRSFAAWLEAHGVPGEHVDRLLGHAQQTVRGRHYSAADLAALKAAVQTIRLDLGDGQGHESGSRQGNEPSEKRGDSKLSAKKNVNHQTLAPVAQWIEQRFPNHSIGNCKQQQ